VKKPKNSKQSRAKKLAKVHALIRQYDAKACTKEAEGKFAEIVVAEHGMYDGPDEIVVLGFFDPIEGIPVDPLPDDAEVFPNGFIHDGQGNLFDYVYDLSMEELGIALRKLGVGTISENNYALDEATGKFYCPPGKNCSNFFFGHVTPPKRAQRRKRKTR
jgi:hypothetical protein